jgi:hypothetical protein
MLYQRPVLVQKASENLMIARANAYTIKSPMPGPVPPDLYLRPGVNASGIRSSGAATDKTMTGAFAVIQAEADLCRAIKWAEVFARLDDIFAGRPEADVAEEIYTKRGQQKDVADILHCDRQSIRRMRDTYVCHCALLAAEKGLITIQEGCKNDM